MFNTVKLKLGTRQDRIEHSAWRLKKGVRCRGIAGRNGDGARRRDGEEYKKKSEVRGQKSEKNNKLIWFNYWMLATDYWFFALFLVPCALGLEPSPW
jgi:hypothetical protein